MSYDRRKIKLFQNDIMGELQHNFSIARHFFMSEDDLEEQELETIIEPHSFFGGFNNLVFGREAFLSNLRLEKTSLPITWRTNCESATSNVFFREGYMTRPLTNTYLSYITSLWSRYRQRRVWEIILVDQDKVIFRQLDYKWRLE